MDLGFKIIGEGIKCWPIKCIYKEEGSENIINIISKYSRAIKDRLNTLLEIALKYKERVIKRGRYIYNGLLKEFIYLCLYGWIILLKINRKA
jgi:hypothetical protein